MNTLVINQEDLPTVHFTFKQPSLPKVKNYSLQLVLGAVKNCFICYFALAANLQHYFQVDTDCLQLVLWLQLCICFWSFFGAFYFFAIRTWLHGTIWCAAKDISISHLKQICSLLVPKTVLWTFLAMSTWLNCTFWFKVHYPTHILWFPCS